MMLKVVDAAAELIARSSLANGPKPAVSSPWPLIVGKGAVDLMFLLQKASLGWFGVF